MDNHIYNQLIFNFVSSFHLSQSYVLLQSTFCSEKSLRKPRKGLCGQMGRQAERVGPARLWQVWSLGAWNSLCWIAIDIFQAPPWTKTASEFEHQYPWWFYDANFHQQVKSLYWSSAMPLFTYPDFNLVSCVLILVENFLHLSPHFFW